MNIFCSNELISYLLIVYCYDSYRRVGERLIYFLLRKWCPEPLINLQWVDKGKKIESGHFCSAEVQTFSFFPVIATNLSWCFQKRKLWVVGFQVISNEIKVLYFLALSVCLNLDYILTNFKKWRNKLELGNVKSDHSQLRENLLIENHSTITLIQNSYLANDF